MSVEAHDHSVACMWGCRTVLGGQLGTQVLSSNLSWRHREDLHSFTPVCHRWLRSNKLRSCTVCSARLLQGRLLSSGLLFVLHLFRVSVEEEIGHDLPRVPREDGACTELPKSGSPTSDPLSELPFVVARASTVHTVQSRISVTQSVVRQAGIRCLYEELVASPRTSGHQKRRLPKGCLDLVGESPRNEGGSNWSGPSGNSKQQHGLLGSVPRENDEGIFVRNDSSSCKPQLPQALFGFVM